MHWMHASRCDYPWPFCDDVALLRSLMWVPPLFSYFPTHSGLLFPGYSFKSKDGKAFIEIEVPGVEKEDIHVETRGHTLVVKAKRYSHDVKDKEKAQPRRSYRFKARLSENVDVDGITASFPGLGSWFAAVRLHGHGDDSLTRDAWFKAEAFVDDACFSCVKECKRTSDNLAEHGGRKLY
ncbi:heat-shock protein Hsp20 [Gracilaria domingensis]|nr:heat-shock protein Hsp20 [Gracilaria domingensis]